MMIKKATIENAKAKPYQYRKTTKAEVELHEDIVIVNGIYDCGINNHGIDLNVNITYVRVFANRADTWKLLSRKTVQLLATPIEKQQDQTINHDKNTN